MQFAYTILYVENVSLSLQFYKEAFGFEIKFMSPEGDYGELISGATTLAFANHSLGESNFKASYQKAQKGESPFGIELAFSTENIEADLAKAIAAGAEEFEPLKQKPWGQKVAYLRDLNGFLIEVCTPMK